MGHCTVVSFGREAEMGTYVAREMSGLVALAALDVLSRARLRAFLSIMSFLLAVLASIRVDTLLLAVSRAVARFLAVDADDGRRVGLALNLLLFAVLTDVTKLVAVAAEGDAAIVDEAGRGETLQIDL